MLNCSEAALVATIACTHHIRCTDLQKHEQAIKQFMQQHNECDMVKKVWGSSPTNALTPWRNLHQELDLVEDDNDVFKLVGPVLVKQDRMEAQSNVEKRLSFISNELSRAEGALQTVQEKRAKKESEVRSEMIAITTTFTTTYGSSPQCTADYPVAAGYAAIAGTAGILGRLCMLV